MIPRLILYSMLSLYVLGSVFLLGVLYEKSRAGEQKQAVIRKYQHTTDQLKQRLIDIEKEAAK